MANNEDLEMQREFERCRAAIDERLTEYFTDRVSYAGLLESMRYSLLAGGKRIRAVICLKFCEAAGGDSENAYDAACAIEMLHAYSLIHDDLPCMDDDDMRRGKPSNHIRFGESTATLAGDALQAAAFETLLNSKLPPGTVAEMGRVLAKAAGPHGICGGQYLDLRGEGKRLARDELEEINKLKTAALISASAQLGVLAAGGMKEQIKAAEEYALAVGSAFQIRDDILDRTAETSGSVETDEFERIVIEETEKAICAIDGIFKDAGFLIWFAQMLAQRKY